MTVLLLIEIWRSCCAIRKTVLSIGKGHVVKFKPVNSTQAYGNCIYRDRVFQGLTTCLSKTEDGGIRLW